MAYLYFRVATLCVSSMQKFEVLDQTLKFSHMYYAKSYVKTLRVFMETVVCLKEVVKPSKFSQKT